MRDSNWDAPTWKSSRMAQPAPEWLNAKAIAGDISDILVIADPKTLGEMRRHYHGELKSSWSKSTRP